MEILTNLFYQLIFTVGLVALFGILISLLRRIFLGISGNAGRYVLLIFGIVGTPIHELSHALMCIIFRHKITEIKLFSPGGKDGSLGHVNHTYNPKNLYHQVGNFFIGVAPVLLGSGAILGLMYLFVPNVFTSVTGELSELGALSTSFFSGATYSEYFAIFGRVFSAIFNIENLSSGVWWAFIFLAVMISSHMELSPADIKGGFKGFAFITFILLIIDVMLFIASPSTLSGLTAVMTSFAVSVVGFLAISLVFLAVMVAVAFVLKLIF